MNNISLPTQKEGWLSSVVDERVATENVELNGEEIQRLIEENDKLTNSISLLYQKHKIKHLSDVITYLESINNSLNQIL